MDLLGSDPRQGWVPGDWSLDLAQVPSPWPASTNACMSALETPSTTLPEIDQRNSVAGTTPCAASPLTMCHRYALLRVCDTPV